MSFLYFVGQLAYYCARHFSFLRNWNFTEKKDTFCLQLGNIGFLKDFQKDQVINYNFRMDVQNMFQNFYVEAY